MLELIVTLGLMGVVMVMLSNLLVSTMMISQKSAARAFIREEIATTIDKIAGDIRSANGIVTCIGEQDGASCTINKTITVTWRICAPAAGVRSICQFDSNNNLIYATSPNVNITYLAFEPVVSQTATASKQNILVTVIGDHSIPQIGVKNVVKQNIIATRNYTF